MNTICRHLLPLALAGAGTIGFTAVASAQVPLDTAVFGTFSGPISTGTSGLFLLPLNGGAVTAIGNLPPELQGTAGGSQGGVSSVDLRSEDGAIVCGTVAAASGPSQGAIYLFVLHLNGTTVDSSQTRQNYLGSTSNVGGVRARMLPNGSILAQAAGLTTGPMAGSLMAIVDVSQPVSTVTPLPTPSGNGFGSDVATWHRRLLA